MYVAKVEVNAFCYGSAENFKNKAKAFEKLGLTVAGGACEPRLGVDFLLRARLLGFKRVQNPTRPLNPLQSGKLFVIRWLRDDT
ncbi:hypothetical protein [Ralstonia pseudosolanacearum]|uniref:hypothetical protein n=1 Tax=Ralstonia pseudosolanacearum TaxID=1310165 RepID=UPI001FFA872F|nr:hypothetical protein [Ralstonia pseudosolanacearum]